jgi:protocatechuate 3,4-dioxygenase beta subunit
MNAKTRNVSRKGLTALVAISAIAMMLLALLPAAAGPGSNMGTVMGTVTDNYNGTPIEDATVIISYHGIVRTEYTDADGIYKFTNVPECFCLKKILVDKEHYRPEQEEVPVSGLTIVNFELSIEEQEPPMGTVKGIVTDLHNGEPIEGALIELRYHDKVLETVTDAEGKYIFTQVDECFCIKTISASAKSYRPESEDINVSGETVVDFHLMIEEPSPPSASLMGTVTDIHNGVPIEGALVQIEQGDHVRKTTTDADGNYWFEYFPAAMYPTYIQVTKEPYRPESKVINVTGETRVDFQLMIGELPPPKDMGTLNGMVADIVTGEAVEGVTVTLEYHDTKLVATTDAKGWYDFTNVPMCFCLKDLTVAMEGYEPQTMSIAIGEETSQNISLVPIVELPEYREDTPNITTGGNGGTGPDLGGGAGFALIALIVSLLGGILFLLTTRLQERS